MTMMVAIAAFMTSVSSCSSDDDKELPLAAYAVGTYEGEEVMTVSGEDTPSKKYYSFTSSADATVNMIIPPTDDEGSMMSLPQLYVMGIPLTKNGDNIIGNLASYTGKVMNFDMVEKAYTVSNLTLIFNGDMVVATYSLKYGNMPFDFTCRFTGTQTYFTEISSKD